MLGQTVLGSRLRDLRSLLLYLGAWEGTTGRPVVLWGDSFAPRNPQGFADPLMGEDPAPVPSEPVGGILALLGGLYEDAVAAVVARGMLTGFASVLDACYCYVPYDVVVPGALTVGDLCDVASALAPLPIRLEGLVDGRNCSVSESDVTQVYDGAIRSHREAGGGVTVAAQDAGDLVPWLMRLCRTP